MVMVMLNRKARATMTMPILVMQRLFEELPAHGGQDVVAGQLGQVA
jgi:hypothetical protein